MKRSLVIFSNTTGFMVGTLMKNLRVQDITVECYPFHEDEVRQYADQGDVFLIYLDMKDNISALKTTMLVIQDVVVRQDKIVLAAGDEETLHFIRRYFPGERIRLEFHRPLELRKMTSMILSLFEDTIAERKSILLVDDDPVYLQMMRGCLSYTYNVIPVTSGAQALVYLMDHEVDLILLDYVMPVTSGPELFRMIRASQKMANTPIVFLTGQNDKRSIMEVMALHPDGYILKMTKLDEVQTYIARILEKNQADSLENKGGK